ncbi:MAG: AEC family transporter [Oscillospiraceae bacterium]|jgi:predicted permease|nr:AEC family transporter [Oscillospiraceae bacterium]
MDMQVILNQMVVLFVLLGIGFVVGKAKVLTKEGNRALTKVILFVALPCTILHSVLESKIDITVGDTMFFLLMSLLVFAIAFAIAIPIVYFTRGDKKNHGLLTYMSVFSNSGFMGFPVVIAIFGFASAFYVALFNIPFNVFSFSIGIMLIAGSKNGRFNPKLLINPPLIASLLAIPIALTGFSTPHIISEAIKLTGNITTPGAMIVIGSTLSYIPLKKIFVEWRIAVITLLKLIVIPLVTWLILRQFISDPMMLGVLVVISGMPTAAQSAMLAVQYDGNEQIASAGVFITTLLCGITVPLIVYLLLM